MTISTTTTRIAYDGDGATTAFAVPFPFFGAGELEVIERDTAAGTEALRILGTHYTVAGGDGAAGTVTASSAPSASVRWVIRRKTARTQATDYTPNDPFPADTHEKALDRLTLIGQELGEESDRSLKFPKTDAADLAPTLPASVARASRVLAFDGAGAPTVSTKTLAQLESEADNAAASASAAASAAAAASASAGSAAGSAVAAATSAAAAAAPILAEGGTAARTVSARFGDALNVKDFGARGDGVTDDTAAIQAALDFVLATNRRIAIPSGTYTVGALTISYAMELRLDKGATLKLKTGANANLLTVAASDVTIRGGTLDGNKANQTANGIAIAATTVDRVLIEDVTIKDTLSYGVRLQDGDDLIVRNCRLTATKDTGIQFFCTGKSVNRALACGNVVDRSDDASYDGGCVKMTNTSGGTTFKFVECRIAGNRATMATAPTGTDVVALEIWCGGLLAAQSCAIVGNTVHGGDFGISLNGNVGGLIEGNSVFGPSGIGIELADSAHCSVVANAINGNSNSAIGIAASGTISPCIHSTVVGNTIQNVKSAMVSNIGIYIGDSATGAIISGNNLFNAGNIMIELNGVNDAVVSENQCDGDSASVVGIAAINGSGVTITGNRFKSLTVGVQIVVNTATTQDRIVVAGNNSDSSVSTPLQKALTNGGALGNFCQEIGNQGYTPGGDAIAVCTLDFARDLEWAVGTTGNPSWTGRAIGSIFSCRQDVGRALWIKEAASGQTAAGYNPVQTRYASTTANRQAALAAVHQGYVQFDTDLGRPIWWDGAVFRDADGLTPKGKDLEGSVTYDAPSIAASGTTTTTLTVTGAALGDYAVCSFGVSLSGLMAAAYVSAADTVTVALFNPTAGAIDLASTTLRARVRKQ
jgi:parallel beta-helix repeat protein